jgi:small subunit ribosomal protein S5e
MSDVEEPVVVEETPAPEVAVEDEDLGVVGGVAEVQLFGKWSFDNIEIRDISLEVSEKRSIRKESMT